MSDNNARDGELSGKRAHAALNPSRFGRRSGARVSEDWLLLRLVIRAATIAQLFVLSLRVAIDRHVRVGILPEAEESLV
jgi:hypothetical protein